MKKEVKKFLQRGIAFGGFGPIVAGIVFFIIDLSGVNIALNGKDIFLAITSTYVLAFLQAGATVFNEIEAWPVAKSVAAHFSVIYVAYISCYLLNHWIPFKWSVIGIFTAIFVIGYFIIWITVYLIIKRTSKKLNESIGHGDKI